MLARQSIAFYAAVAAARTDLRDFRVTLPRLISLFVVATAFAMLLPANLLAQAPCSGHQLLSTPRPEGSCQNVATQTFVSPDKTMRALVMPSSVSLDTTPDMESRVVIRSSTGTTLTSKDYSSPRGMDGFYVYQAKWSPDSQFFVYSLTSSGGHSPWSFPIMVYSRKANRFAAFSDMINGNPTVSGEFSFVGANTVAASTWKKPGSIDDKVRVTADLGAAFEKLPATKKSGDSTPQ
jgi:hypothetical protein